MQAFRELTKGHHTGYLDTFFQKGQYRYTVVPAQESNPHVIYSSADTTDLTQVGAPRLLLRASVLRHAAIWLSKLTPQEVDPWRYAT